jgi:Flp pilus assembly protein TadB
MHIRTIHNARSRMMREKYKTRLATLVKQYHKGHYEVPAEEENESRYLCFFSDLAARAGMKSGTRLLLYCSSSAVAGFTLGVFLHSYSVVPLATTGFFLPMYFAYISLRERAVRFSEEYPVVLLATASNMKAGLTVYGALERSILLLPDESEIKKEVKIFLERISRGMPKEEAVRLFARYVALPELDLFRRAFGLVLSHGGKFSRTLERLAQVCRDRENLVRSAKVSTASMRMTANILLAVAPVLLVVMSLRTPDYWNVFFTNHIAFTLGCIGTLIIVASFLVLRSMSDFKA